MAMSPRKRLGVDQRRVLQLLARSTNGHTESTLLAFATAMPEAVRAGKRPIKVVRVRITDAGRMALAG